MALRFTTYVNSSSDNFIQKQFSLCSNGRKYSSIRTSVAKSYFSPLALDAHLVLLGTGANLRQRCCGFKLWILEKFNFEKPKHKKILQKESKRIVIEGQHKSLDHLETSLSSKGKVSEDVFSARLLNDHCEETKAPISPLEETVIRNYQTDASPDNRASMELSSPFSNLETKDDRTPSLCITIIGATGELARKKIFPALFALYYSGFLPENVGFFGYSRKNLTDEGLRSIIASTLTCRVDHQQNCGDKMDAFLSRTFFLNGDDNNREGMARLNARMEQIEGKYEANRIFYLSVPQEALIDVASSVADYAQSQKGWNRIIIEKPFGFDVLSSYQLTQSLLSKFREKQIYRIDHLLGRNLIENLTVLRFSNLVFEPLWSRTYIRNVQVILSEEWGLETRGRYFDGYGIIRDIVHSHVLQTIALFAMESPISLYDEDIRNEKVKVLRSIRKLGLGDVVLGQFKASSPEKVDVYMNTLTPTFFAAALYINNARWDGVPFLIKTGMGLIKHRMEIRIQFHTVPGNLYRDCIGQNFDLATNELILRDVPDEAILVKVNNKVPGLGLQLDASELNLLYKDKYNVEVPDSYEHLLLDVVDGDNHLFMRSDELAAAWNILAPVLREIDENKIAPELYEIGGRGPVGAYYLGAKHGVRWADD